MKKYLFLALISLFTTVAFAQRNNDNDLGIKTLKFEVRGDFDCFSQHDSIWHGFTGKYLNIILKGDFNDKFFYAYRQRLNKANSENSFFDATDYLYLGWRITKNISWTAGKEVVAMGGIEYDLAPIDVYFASLSWGLACYQFGTNLQFTTNDGSNTFTLQCTNSPFGEHLYSGMYNYSVHWHGTFKHFGPVCSVNMYEYRKGDFLNVIALGTTFNFGPVDGHLDFFNRTSERHNKFIGDDISLVGQIGVNLMQNRLHLFAKATYDVNELDIADDPSSLAYNVYVLPGTDIKSYGGGIEFCPIKGKNDLRFHTFFAINDVKRRVDNITVPNPSVTHGDDGTLSIVYNEDTILKEVENNTITYQFNIGLTWRLNYIDK